MAEAAGPNYMVRGGVTVRHEKTMQASACVSKQQPIRCCDEEGIAVP